MTTRRQATLYLPAPARAVVDALRQRFNPAQAALIGAHVTLCREDEVDDWDALAARLAAVGRIDVALNFGAPLRDRDLAYWPAIGSTASFDDLRFDLLSKAGAAPRKQPAHITLVHPRNGACTDAVWAQIQAQAAPFTARFRSVALIEQTDGGPWRDLAVFG